MAESTDIKAPQSPHETDGASDSVGNEVGSTERKVWIGFAFALACLGLVGLAAYLSVVRLNENTAWVEHTYQVLNRLDLLIAAATDSETSVRGYVITGDVSYLQSYRQAAQLVDVDAGDLGRLTVDNPAEQRRLDAVVSLAPATHRIRRGCTASAGPGVQRSTE